MADVIGRPVPDLSLLKRRAEAQAIIDTPDAIVVSFTITPDGQVGANIPPGLSIGAVGTIILLLQSIGAAMIKGSGS